MSQLKLKDIPTIREKLWKRQKKICQLCSKEIAWKDAALDHDHVTGHCRATLHKNCNSVEGRVLHWAKRSGVPASEFLESLLRYWSQDYSHNPIHPRHKTDRQKKLKILRTRLKRAKKEHTKQRLRDLIKEL